MIKLRDCIVGVKDEKEYEKVIQIAKEQGCKWNSETLWIAFTVHFQQDCFLIKEEGSHLGHIMKNIVTIIVKI